MDVRLDNYLDDLPAAEELKTDLFGSPKSASTSGSSASAFSSLFPIPACHTSFGASPEKRKRRLIAVVAAITVLLLVCLITFLAVKTTGGKHRNTNNGGNKSSAGPVPDQKEKSLEPSQEFKEILGLLLDDVGVDVLTDTSSPQHAAAKWIADEDPRRNGDRGLYQRFALAVLYFTTNGSGWIHGLDFLSHKHECDWNAPFEHFDGTIKPMGVLCDQHKKVTSLTLRE